MAEHTLHITQKGDRWDSIAFKYMGDATNIKPIIDANPMVPLHTSMDAGIEIYIPIFDPQPLEDYNNLPPWKRPQNG